MRQTWRWLMPVETRQRNSIQGEHCCMDDMLTVAEASRWSSQYYKRDISKSNISYLIAYGRISSLVRNGSIMVYRQELKNYYDEEFAQQRKALEQLDGGINFRLAFAKVREKERTKHVHRLHPYKGKFIPQLVEYFLDSRRDEYKQDVYFEPGDIVLDPFCGSGTTLVQAAELGLHAAGFDISEFNALIANTKVHKHDLPALIRQIRSMTSKLLAFYDRHGLREFDGELSARLSRFNADYFPSPGFKLRVRKKEVNPKEYGAEKARLFAPVFDDLAKKYAVDLQNEGSSFLERWYLPSVRAEIEYLSGLIQNIDAADLRNTLWVILSRTIRSARATPHLDLATLKEPVFSTYYCRKHLKICKPLFTLTGWWKRYTDDAVRRFVEFDSLRTNTFQLALAGDSRSMPLLELLDSRHPEFADLIRAKKIAGIFTSPPYVGMIDYHEQHAYAYELMGIDRRDDAEIGPLFRGKGKEARASYVQGIADVLKRCKPFLIKDYNVFLVANDKHGLYPEIAELARMKIVNRFERPVLRRAEFDQSAYSETIFRLKEIQPQIPA